MGKKTDVERCLAACASNKLPKLEKIFSSATDIVRQQVLNATDKDGRTCLIIAVIKDHIEIVKYLLQRGARVDYINPASKAGSALHEAAARKLTRMVALLLQCGANPFAANTSGATPYELAVLAGSLEIVRMFEGKALFSGEVDVQWSELLGLSNNYKTRHVTIMHNYPTPVGGQAQPVRLQMSIKSSCKEVMPKCRLWLNGCTSYRTAPNGFEAVVRLHPNHGEPAGNIFTRTTQGAYCFFTRPSGIRPEDRNRWLAMLRLCSLCEQGPALTSLSRFLDRGSSGSEVGPGVLPLLLPPAQARASSMAPPASPGPQQQSPVPRPNSAAVPARSPAAGPVPPLPLAAPYVQPAAMTPERSTVSNGATPWPTPVVAMPPAVPARPMASPRFVQSAGGDNVDRVTALPGESDRAYAARLASLSAGGAITSTPSPAASPAAPWPLTMPVPSWDPDAAPSAPPLMMASPCCAAVEAQQAARSPLAPVSAPVPPFASRDEPVAGEAMCVVCLNAPREVGFLHGSTAHRCVCTGCSKHFVVGRDLCPMCRQPIENVLGIF